MVFGLFKKKTTEPEPAMAAIPASRIAKAASIDESLLQAPAPAPVEAPAEKAPVPATPPISPAIVHATPERAPPTNAALQAAAAVIAEAAAAEQPPAPEPEAAMKPYYKIPLEYWTSAYGPYLSKDLGLDPKAEWNIVTLPSKAEDVLFLRTIQHPGAPFPLHAAALSLTLPLLHASFERMKEGLTSRGEKPGSPAYQAVVRQARKELSGLADYVIQETLHKAIKREEFFPDPSRSELYFTALLQVLQPKQGEKFKQQETIDLSDPLTIDRYKLTPYYIIPQLFWENEFALLIRNTLNLDREGSWNRVMLPLDLEDAVRLGLHNHPGDPPPEHVSAIRNMLRVINAEFALKSSQIGMMQAGEFSTELAELMLRTSEKVQSLAGLHAKKLKGPMKDLNPPKRASA